MRGLLLTALILGGAVTTLGCHGGSLGDGLGPSPPSGVSLLGLTVTSSSLGSNKVFPVDFTCDGASTSPALTWSTPPAGTQSIAIVLEDPDAPGKTFVHWVVWNMPPDRETIAAGVDPTTLGAIVGINDHHSEDYYGPCPPKEEIHDYYFHVFAVDSKLSVPPGADRDGLYAGLHGHVLAEGYLRAQFSR